MSESPKKYGGYRIVSIRETLASEDVLAIGFVGRSALPALVEEIERLSVENERLTGLINSPITDDWLEGVRMEAAHQQARWGSDHDAGKSPADWFWLVGYLAGKALHAATAANADKAKHHTISTGASLFNWWRHISADELATMRPGIELSADARSALSDTTGEEGK